MRNNVYIKMQDGRIDCKTLEQLKIFLSQADSSREMIGIDESGAHYLFQLNEARNEFRQYPLRKMGAHPFSLLPLYFIYDHVKKIFYTTPNPIQGERPLLPQSGFFNEAEIEKIKTDLKKADGDSNEYAHPFFKDSALSKDQQKMLYMGFVSLATSHASFSTLLEREIAGLSQKEKIAALQMMICNDEFKHHHIALNSNEEINIAVYTILFEFFSVDRIIDFSDVLHRNQQYSPTVGDVIDYYTYCIQIKLQALQSDQVPFEWLRHYSKETRAIKLGEKLAPSQISRLVDFKETVNPQGLRGVEAIVFETMMSLFLLNKHYHNDVNILSILAATFERRRNNIAILDFILKFIQSIVEKKETDIQYLEIFNAISVVYSKDRWASFLPTLKKARNLLYPDVVKQILSLNHAPENLQFIMHSIDDRHLLNNLIDHLDFDAQNRSRILVLLKNRLPTIINKFEYLSDLFHNDNLNSDHVSLIIHAMNNRLVNLVRRGSQLLSLVSFQKFNEDDLSKILNQLANAIHHIDGLSPVLKDLLSMPTLSDENRQLIWFAVAQKDRDYFLMADLFSFMTREGKSHDSSKKQMLYFIGKERALKLMQNCRESSQSWIAINPVNLTHLKQSLLQLRAYYFIKNALANPSSSCLFRPILSGEKIAAIDEMLDEINQSQRAQERVGSIVVSNPNIEKAKHQGLIGEVYKELLPHLMKRNHSNSSHDRRM